MSIRVDFNRPIDGGSGRKDVMRVLASSGVVSDDFSPLVIFSSQYSACLVEKFSATVTNMTPGQNSTASGSWNMARKYADYPNLLISYTQDNGVILQPYVFTQTYNKVSGQGNGDVTRTVERVETLCADVISLGSNSYRIDWAMQNYGIDSAIRSGVLRVYAFGRPV